MLHSWPAPTTLTANPLQGALAAPTTLHTWRGLLPTPQPADAGSGAPVSGGALPPLVGGVAWPLPAPRPLSYRTDIGHQTALWGGAPARVTKRPHTSAPTFQTIDVWRRAWLVELCLRPRRWAALQRY